MRCVSATSSRSAQDGAALDLVSAAESMDARSSFEEVSSSFSITFDAYSEGVGASGSYSATFGGEAETGRFDAVWCADPIGCIREVRTPARIPVVSRARLAHSERMSEVSAEGRCRLVAPGVVLLEMPRDQRDPKFVDRVIAQLERVVPASGPYKVFVDAYELEQYHSSLRIGLTEWFRVRRDRLDLHVVFRSKLVSMGVAVASITLGGSLHPYSSMAEFEAALEKAKRRR